jgi:serine/threonine-protein kinase
MIGDAVAIKVLHAEQVADPQAAERFRREAQAAARLKHPNAVSIYDFGVSEVGLVYLVMELVEGQSLRDILKQQGPLTPPAAAEVMTQACAALDEAHRQNVVHRDIKPDNIIVAAAPTGLKVKVLDFGIAKLRDLSATASNLTQAGSVMGTPHYMSPEQCLGEELDSRSDIYSLGVVLYEMLAGVAPFNSPTSTAVIIQHVNQPPPPLRTINVSISSPVEAVVLHAMEKRREARPQTAGALAQELVAAVGGRAIAPQPQVSAHLSPGISGSLGSASPASGMEPTMVIKTPVSGSIAQVSGLGFPSGSMPTETQRKGRGLLMAALGLLVLALGGGGVVWFLRSPVDRESPAKPVETTGGPQAPPGMAYVPGGELAMGNTDGTEAERPQHLVVVRPFFIDTVEVTCEDYQRFVLAKGYSPPATWLGQRFPQGSARRPVTGVTWDDATSYAAWIGKRLPTEEEWEFAARGTDGRRYPWGGEWKTGFSNADSTAIGHMSDVGAYSAGASPFGVLDLVGNAWEWTSSDLTAYPGGQLPSDRMPGELKVIRGGCWRSDMTQATATFRIGWPARGHDEYDDTGFRCAKDVVQRAFQ